jgi:predicted RNase H-like HicB family nuclease
MPSSYPAILHCYARPEKNHYIAVCLELDLIDQGATIEEAKVALEENIVGYLESLTADDFPHLFPRYAPFYVYLDYYRVFLLVHLGKLVHQLRTRWLVFGERLSLQPQLLLHG